MWRTTFSIWWTSDYNGISIHVLRVEDDAASYRSILWLKGFQSTSSVWRTTSASSWMQLTQLISIHVLHVEDDNHNRINVFRFQYFNPRPPCGGRRDRHGSCLCSCRFQSTSSMWRTTGVPSFYRLFHVISIHVLHVEDDAFVFAFGAKLVHFNPRPPCGGRRSPIMQTWLRWLFQSTSSMWRTTSSWILSAGCPTFQSTSSMWRTTMSAHRRFPLPPFQSTSSMWRTTTRITEDETMTQISIHVLHVEDDFWASLMTYWTAISIHVLHVEDDASART